MAHTLGVSSSDIVTAAEYLRLGGVVGLPTETVYGLAASAFNSEAVSEIFRLKGRPPNNPLIVHIHDFDQVDRLARRIPPSLSKIVDEYWPGALTVVLEAHPDIPGIVLGGGSTVGIRMPAHPVFREVLSALGEPLAAPSANRSNHVSPTNAFHVESDFPDENFPILDAGPSTIGLESTVLSLVGTPKVLRLGGISASALQKLIPDLQVQISTQQTESPGTSSRHYAPKTSFRVWFNKQPSGSFGVLVFGTPFQHEANKVWDLGDKPLEAAKKLYSTIREMDQSNFDSLFVVLPNQEQMKNSDWTAIIDRLGRATQSK
ncbi:MAG: threonylcarbamoyl-AMP synthase [Phycisphaerae bacterium]|nr:threonylcarbamoyl-AMP synthase [Phycisphaerae bacterium]